MPSDIADRFRKGIRQGYLFEPTIYYKVQTDCMSAVMSAGSIARVSLLCAAKLAEMLANRLESGPVSADEREDWEVCANALERSIRLADSNNNPTEVVWGLAGAIADIVPSQLIA